MVRALILAARAVTQSAGKQLYEAAGATALVIGAAMWDPAAGWAVAGLALLGKSLEHDLTGQGGSDG